MKCLLRLLAFSAVLSSLLAGCDLFNPEDYAEGLSPVDSMTVFHNLVNAYNTLDYEAFLLCLDPDTFCFVPKDTTQGTYYKPWGYEEEDVLTFAMFEEFKTERRIPPLILQIDTTRFFATDTLASLHANYLLITPLVEYDTLAGGFELKIRKRGNYWYISNWQDVAGETLFVEHETEEGETTIDTIAPKITEHDWSDLKVYFRMEVSR
ncbi:hypothetical protein KAX21_03915 [candidate division WOR-3 bacterium]|nr:hypothetical protein [candidate division WOR-3 bacterium]